MNDTYILLTIGAWIFAFIIACITVHSWIKGMDTAREQSRADTYMVSGSFKLKIKKDRFLYSTITKIRRPSSNTGSRSGRRGRF